MSESCNGCRFWFANSPDDTTGWCRQKHPTIIAALLTINRDKDGVYTTSDYLLDATEFPVTSLDDWCGEYQEIRDDEDN